MVRRGVSAFFPSLETTTPAKRLTAPVQSFFVAIDDERVVATYGERGVRIVVADDEGGTLIHRRCLTESRRQGRRSDEGLVERVAAADNDVSVAQCFT